MEKEISLIKLDLPKTKPKLSIVKTLTQNIPPTAIHQLSIPPVTKPSYHPAIIKACQMTFGKPPDLLSPDETLKFEQYKAWKIKNGMPIENDPIYKSRT